MVRILNSTLPLHVFIRRAQVLQVYRQLLRATRPCSDPQLKQDLVQQIQVEFRRNQFVQDKNLIRSCISDATKAVKKIQDVCSPHQTPAAVKTTSSTDANKKKKDPNSWLGVEDEIDPRGRVGEGWPWQS